MENERSWEIQRLSDYELLETLVFDVANKVVDSIQPAPFSMFSKEQNPWTTLECGTLPWDLQVEQLSLMFYLMMFYQIIRDDLTHTNQTQEGDFIKLEL